MFRLKTLFKFHNLSDASKEVDDDVKFCNPQLFLIYKLKGGLIDPTETNSMSIAEPHQGFLILDHVGQAHSNFGFEARTNI